MEMLWIRFSSSAASVGREKLVEIASFYLGAFMAPALIPSSVNAYQATQDSFAIEVRISPFMSYHLHDSYLQ